MDPEKGRIPYIPPNTQKVLDQIKEVGVLYGTVGGDNEGNIPYSTIKRQVIDFTSGKIGIGSVSSGERQPRGTDYPLRGTLASEVAKIALSDKALVEEINSKLAGEVKGPVEIGLSMVASQDRTGQVRDIFIPRANGDEVGSPRYDELKIIAAVARHNIIKGDSRKQLKIKIIGADGKVSEEMEYGLVLDMYNVAREEIEK